MQTIYRTAPASNFAIFSNELVNTPMPFKAKEVLIYLLSKPKDWRVKVADIRSSLALTTHTIRRSLEWLQSAGYAGAERAVLHISRTEGRTSIVRIKAGAHGPRHSHGAGEHAYVLEGKVDIGGHILGPGDYLYTEAGEEHALVALEDSVLFATTERPIMVTQTEEVAATRKS